MLLTRQEFAKRRENNTLHIAFIGMSNTGKSFRSDQLHNFKNFEYVHVDDEIEKELGLQSMAEMADWMGYPFDERYEKRAIEYLHLETKHTVQTNINPNKKFVLDTTGSVIYLNSETHKYLQKNFLCISFDIQAERVEKMTTLFFKEPKSVYWGNSFSQNKNEDNIDAIKRCYPQLLEDRKNKYRELADVIIPGEISQYAGLSIDRFMEIISFALPEQKS